ncbi:MerR family transcriptional regulator [Paenibacillus methanolicus]|uniref:DNA-binding transcriptional MerR regulator n=1 Tax=Paenibacillus methanolicus TaxID=582686 RepID=A0A5S5CBS6_9BACL|nr:MerR family transcriptional regulator [Paenibacillus methanolicus]TYP76825.1 DNA-binding transcriptional MerR regulator [Paenibacillus methanolicus]
MRISELARLTNVSARAIRHYEEKGLLQAERLDNDYRDFKASAVDRIHSIQLYLKLGLTADEIRSLFTCEVASPDDYEYCEEMLEIYEGKLRKVNRQIESMLQLKKLLERQVELTVAGKNKGDLRISV